MLQKIVNGIAIASGVVSLTVVGLGGYVFIRKDAIIENVKGKIMESVMPGGMSGILGGGDAGAGALGDLGLPSMSPSEGTEQSSPMSPIPLGF